MELVQEKYKQTEIGLIPNDWELKTIAEIITEISMGPFGSDIKVSNFVDKGVPVLNGYNVSGTILKNKYSNFVTKEKAKSLKKAVARRGDIIVTHRGTIGQISYIPFNSEFKEYVISQSQFRFSLNNKKALYDFVVFFFHSDIGQNIIMEKKGHTGVPAIAQATTTFKKISIPLPSLHEQQAIATTLSNVDVWINSLEQLIAKKRLIKLGAMQELLKPKEGWEVKKLGEIAQFFKGRGLPKSHLEQNGKFKCIHYGELFTKYKEVINEIISRTNEDENTFLSVANDVLMPTSDVTPNGLATASCIKENGVILGGDVLVIRMSENILNGTFLSYYVTLNREMVMKLVSGSTVYHLYGSDMKDLIVEYPKTKEEQTRIATILSDMDAEITTLEKKIEKAKQIKVGMMQELLTGRIRLV